MPNNPKSGRNWGALSTSPFDNVRGVSRWFRGVRPVSGRRFLSFFLGLSLLSLMTLGATPAANALAVYGDPSAPSVTLQTRQGEGNPMTISLTFGSPGQQNDCSAPVNVSNYNSDANGEPIGGFAGSVSMTTLSCTATERIVQTDQAINQGTALEVVFPLILDQTAPGIWHDQDGACSEFGGSTNITCWAQSFAIDDGANPVYNAKGTISAHLAWVSVGDFVWYDTNHNGIQDPGEPGIAGVQLTIAREDGSAALDVNGNPVGPATTDSTGKYLFTNLAPLAQGSGEFYKVTPGPIPSSSPYAGAAPTIPNAGPDDIDSSSGSGNSRTLWDGGDIDSTIDFGFFSAPAAPTVSVGDFVWLDANHNGVQDGEAGIAGVVMSIKNSDGSDVVDASGNPVTTTTTDSSGHYSFDNLVPGTYTVSVGAVPAGLAPTMTGAGTSATDSSTGSATSGALDGVTVSSDTSLDFGFWEAHPVRVGDYVWHDFDYSGTQGDLNPATGGPFGIPNVVVTITRADGSPAMDVNGNVVTSTTTDASGKYMFDNLEPGYAYTVSVDKNQPTLVGQNFVPTVSGKGTPATDSSAAEGSVTSALLDGVNVTEDLSLDFGYVCRIRVGDYVWVDTNKDGIQNETGTGIPGVTLTLTTWDGQPVTNVYGNPVGPVTTDSNGYYLFDDLTPNTYIVHIDNSQPALSPMVPTLSHQGGNGALDSSTGSEYTGALDNTYVIQDMTLDFGFVLSGVSVGDLVWVDSNHDGVQGATEAGIPGITMTITNADGTPAKDLDGNTVTTTTTDGSGKYVFSNLVPGTYKVAVGAVPAGLVPTITGAGTTATDSSTDTATSVALDGTTTVLDPTLDFGFWTSPDVLISKTAQGQEADTSDTAVVLHPSEPLTFVVTNNGDEDLINVSVTDLVTSGDGTVSGLSCVFPDDSTGVTWAGPFVIGGSFTCSATLSGGTAAAGEHVDEATVTGTGRWTGNPVTSTNPLHGVYPVSVGDLVWVDSNHDGVQDATEVGIPGVTMTITNADGTPAKDLDGNTVTTTMTDGSGKYMFSNLVPGTYKVAVGAVPAGLVPTITGAGTPATDSSTDTATSVALNGTTTASDTTLDFGFVHLVSIGDYVWYDSNRNGVQDEGEAAVANVTVNLYDGEGQLVSSKVTDANGYYAFNDLMPSTDFVVEFVAPTNTTFTDPVMGSDRAVDSNADPVTGWALVTTPVTGLNLVDPGMADDPSIDAGLVKLVSVGDVVWLDVNRDGLQTPGEPLLQGVTVNLYDQDGVMVDSTVTDADGFYSFTDLLAGASYSLEFVKPDGSVFTTALAGTDRAIDSDAPANGMVAITAPADGMNSAVTPDDPTFDAGLVTQINLVLAKDLISSGTVAPGEVVTFALTPSNQGPMDALPGWSVTEVMPAGLELVDMSGEGYTCDVATATCVAGSGLAAGASGAVITVHAKVGAVASGSLKNVAFVAPSTEDVVETNPLGNPPTTATDTTTSTTDNDAQASVSVKTPSLPRTGSEVPQWAGLVPLLLAAGGILLLVGRRRKTTTN